MRKIVTIIAGLILALPVCSIAENAKRFYQVDERFGFVKNTSEANPYVDMPTNNELKYSIANSWEGFEGGAMQSMLYFYRTMKTPLVFAEPFDAYVLKVGVLRFYANENSAMPYVQLFANGRIPFGKDMPYMANGRAEIASQVSRNVSVGGVVNYVGASGVNGLGFHQMVNGAVWTNLELKRYGARLTATINDWSMAPQYDARQQANTAFKHQTLHFAHYWRFTDAIRLMHTLKWEGATRNYLDKLENVNDSIAFQTVRNTLTLEALRENNALPFSLRYYFEHDYRYHANYIRSELTRPLMNDHHLHTGFVLFDARPVGEGTLRYDVAGDVYVYGILTSESNLNVNVTYDFNIHNEPLSIGLGVGGHRDSNTKFITRYDACNISWSNDFSRFHRVDGVFTIALPKRGISLDIKNDNVLKYIYFAEDGKPVQDQGWLHVVSADLKADLKLHRDVYWENHAIYQYASNRDILPLPDFTIYSKLYYQHTFANGNPFTLRTGLDLRYYTAFYANEYDPYTGIFHLQKDQKIGSYPELGLFADFMFSGVTLELGWKNWNNGLFGGDYYYSPGYMDNRNRLYVACRWVLL